MAIDLGNRRVGLAISDPTGFIASPLKTLDRKAGGWRQLLRDEIALQEISEVVVGLPKNMDGTVGAQALLCEKFALELEQETGLKVHLLDERLSSVAAGAALRESGRRTTVKGAKDAVAASLILQVFLEKRRNQGGNA